MSGRGKGGVSKNSDIPVVKSARVFGYETHDGKILPFSEFKKRTFTDYGPGGSKHKQRTYVHPSGEILYGELDFEFHNVETPTVMNVESRTPSSTAWLEERLADTQRKKTAIAMITEIGKQTAIVNQNSFKGLNNAETNLIRRVNAKVNELVSTDSTIEKDVISILEKLDKNTTIGEGDERSHGLYSVDKWREHLSKIFVQGSSYDEWIGTNAVGDNIAFKIVASLFVNALDGKRLIDEAYRSLIYAVAAFLKKLRRNKGKCFNGDKYCALQLWAPKTMEDDPQTTTTTTSSSSAASSSSSSFSSVEIDEEKLERMSKSQRRVRAIELLKKDKTSSEEKAELKWLKKHMVPFYGPSPEETVIYTAFVHGTPSGDVGSMLTYVHGLNRKISENNKKHRAPQALLDAIKQYLDQRKGEKKTKADEKQYQGFLKQFEKLKKIGMFKDAKRPKFRDYSDAAQPSQPPQPAQPSVTTTSSSVPKGKGKKRVAENPVELDVEALSQLSTREKRAKLVELFAKENPSPKDKAERKWLWKRVNPFHGPTPEETVMYAAFSGGTLGEVTKIIDLLERKNEKKDDDQKIRASKVLLKAIADYMKSLPKDSEDFDDLLNQYYRFKDVGKVDGYDRPEFRDISAPKKRPVKEVETTEEPTAKKQQKPTEQTVQKPTFVQPTPVLPPTVPVEDDDTEEEEKGEEEEQAEDDDTEEEEEEEEGLIDILGDDEEEGDLPELSYSSSLPIQTLVSNYLIEMMERVNQSVGNRNMTKAGVIRMLRNDVTQLSTMIDNYVLTSAEGAIQAMIANNMDEFHKRTNNLSREELAEVFDRAVEEQHVEAIQALMSKVSLNDQ